ncbi:multidrug effflux MFS transporter [Roseibium sp. HPY-6]|uniref:multidrug effflux MFS transporter n=1 Tax=Roseibium sp. HPY-6 TaxID=3229852 RepID=UPI00338FFCD6
MARTPPHLITIILLTAFSPLSLNMFLPSLGNIAEDLETNYALVSVAIAGYLAVTAVIQLIAGPLADRYGRRPVLLATLAIFSVSSLVCAQAEDVWVFLFFRMLQGGITAGYTLSLAIVRDTHEPQKAAGLIGYISMCMAIAPMLGPVFGGLLDTAFGWRANFYLYATCGVLLLALCWVDLGETKPDRQEHQQSMAAATLALVSDLRFWAYALCSTFTVGAFYIFLAGAPLVATTSFGVTTAELGFLIGSITVGFSAGGFLAGRYSSRLSLPAMMLVGRITACTGLTIGLVAFLFGTASPMVFFASTVFVGIGNGLTIPGSNSGAMSIRPDLAGSAAGLVGALTLAGGSALTSLAGLAVGSGEQPITVLALMLASSVLGLVFALGALVLERSGADR